MNLLISYEIQSDASAEPLTLADAKAAMKVSFTDDDALITDLCTAARQWLENYTGVALRPKTVKVVVEMASDEWYQLPRPVTGIVSVTLDHDCVDYKLYGDMIKVHYPGIHEILVQCGYATAPDDMVNDLKRIVAWAYQNRGIELSNEVASLTGFPELFSVYYKKVVI
jgi:hypothetical protein